MAVLLCCYRDKYKALIPPLLEKWQPILGVQVARGIKEMNTSGETTTLFQPYLIQFGARQDARQNRRRQSVAP
jgi:hypothetical protein